MSQIWFIHDAKKFSTAEVSNGLAWIQAYPYDSWSHPLYTDTTVNPETALQMKANFDANVLGHEVATDYEHGLDPAKGTKASGWIKAMDVRDDGLYFGVALTEQARKEITDGEWKYFSTSHWDEWTHPHTGQKFAYVVDGGALTNKPWVKNMAALPLNFSEFVVERKDMEDSNDVAAGEPTPGQEPDPIKHDDRDRAPGSVGADKNIPESDVKDAGKEGVVDIEAQLREILNLPEGDLIETVKQLSKEVQPIREAAKQHSQRKAFSEAYPDEANRLAELEQTDRENKARKFSERYLEFTDEEGKSLRKGFSRAAVDKIENFYKEFSAGKATLSDLDSVLTSVAATGIVEYGEIGSSIVPESDAAVHAAGLEGSKQFAAKVVEIQAQDKVDYATAVSTAAKNHPKLFSAHLEYIGKAESV